MLPPNGDQIEHGRRRTPLGYRPPVEKGGGAELAPRAPRPRTLLSLLQRGLRHPGDVCLENRAVLGEETGVSFWSLASFGVLPPLGRDLSVYICFVLQENLKSKSTPQKNHWKRNRNVNLQELPPLGEADCVVASFQVRVLGELAAHLSHLVVRVHEEAVLHVLTARLGSTTGTFTMAYVIFVSAN